MSNAMINLGALGLDLILDKDGWNSAFKSANDDIVEHENKWDKFSKNMSGKVKLAITGTIVGIGLAFKGMLKSGLETSNNLNKALNDLQASTGAADSEMQELKDTMTNIYASNHGEDFNDIADALQNVKTATGLTGKALEDTTRTAIIMRDTFQFEVNESVRAADTMMKNFGITSNEAYTLIAQGAQMGANKNGDLLDVLNEYAPQFKELGFSAEGFTDTLIKGAKEGAFSIDKVGDAIKEFNIRAKDGSDTSKQAFESLGFSASQMTSEFARGGESAQRAFTKVMKALNDVKDPVLQNTIGVQLFGTMWEDLGGKAVTALIDIENSTDKTADTLKKIDEVKYDNIGDAIEGVKRQVETSLMPVFNSITAWINNNRESIETFGNTVATILSVVADVIGFLVKNINILLPALIAVGTIFATLKIADFIESISGGIGKLTGLFKGLNPTMMKTVGIILLVVGALTALGVVIATIMKRNDEMSNTFKAIGQITPPTIGAPKLPSYAVGTPYVPHDQIAQIHEGEMIVPKEYNPNAGGKGLGGNTIINVNLDAERFKDVQTAINTLNELKSTSRMGVTSRA